MEARDSKWTTENAVLSPHNRHFFNGPAIKLVAIARSMMTGQDSGKKGCHSAVLHRRVGD